MSEVLGYTRRTCDECGRGMQPYWPRQRVNDKLMCPMCATNEGFRMSGSIRVAVRHHQGAFDKTSTPPKQGLAYFLAADQPNIVRLAHDSGDSVTVFHCFSGDTRYITRDGVKTFAETVGTNQFVLTGNADDPHGGFWVESPIRELGEQRIWEVTLKRNRRKKVVRTTSGHRWLVRHNKSVVTTEGLKPGHRLAHLRARQFDTVPSSLGIRTGFVFGDGHIQHRENQTYGAVTLWADKRELAKYFDETATRGYAVESPNGVPGLRYTSGMIGLTKTLPGLHESPDFLLGWLMGYFAADGSVTKAGQATLSSASLETLLHVRDVATVLGIGTYEPTSRRRTGFGDQESEIHAICFVAADLRPDFFLRDAHRSRVDCERPARLGWTVESVVETDSVEPVYCARVHGTDSFALEDNIHTGNCPFCGSGQVIARSDGSIECEFCHSAFTVQVQPEFSAFPQTIGGVPVDVPGMGPDQQPMDDPGAEQDMGELPPGAQTQGGEEEPLDEEGEEEDDEEDVPAFMKKSYRTESGAELDLEHYLQHLALKSTANRQEMLAAIQADNSRPR